MPARSRPGLFPVTHEVQGTPFFHPERKKFQIQNRCAMGWTPARTLGAQPLTDRHQQRAPPPPDDRAARTMGWQPARQVGKDGGNIERPVTAREPYVREKSNSGWNVSQPHFREINARALPGPDTSVAWDDSTKVSSQPKSKSRGNGGWGIASPRGGGRSSPRGIPTGWEAETRNPRHAEPVRSPDKAASGARFATDDARARSGLARSGYALPA